MKYTILSLGKDTRVKFDHDDGTTSTQTIANLPIDSVEGLEAALTEYEKAYTSGKKAETVEAAPEVAALINKVQDLAK